MRFTVHRQLVFLLAIGLAGCGGNSPEHHLDMARQALRKNDLKTAEIELKTVLQAAPGNVQARLLLAKTMQEKGSWEDSEKELRKAQERGAPADETLPMLARAWVKMGKFQELVDMRLPASGMGSQAIAAVQAERANANMALGKPEDAARAIAEGDQALQATGSELSRDLELARARLALVNKKPEDAMSILDTVLRKDAAFVEAMYLKAQLLQMQNKDAEAVKVYEQIATSDPTQFYAHLALADHYLRKGDLTASEKAIQAAEKVAGGAPLVNHARGTLELLRGNLDKANNALLAALRAAPDYLPSVLAYAMVSYSMGNYEQSMKNAGKVLGAVPGNIMAGQILAGSQLKTGDIKGALKTLEPLMAMYPNDAKLLALAGDVYLEAKDYKKAQSYLDRAAELEPKSAIIKTRQAAGHLALGDTTKALAALEGAASLSTKPGQADLMLVMLHLKDKQYDKALRAIDAMEKKLPNNPVTHNLRAAALLGKQDRIGARKALEQAIAIEPNFFAAASNLARLDMQENKPDAARKRFLDILARDKNNTRAMLALADLAAARKQDRDYVSWMEKAIKADPKAMHPRDALIRYHLSKQENSKALAIAKETANANPDSPQALNMLGAAQLATGDTSGAIATFTKLTEKVPDSPDAYLHLAVAQLAARKNDAARLSLNKALGIKPDHVLAQTSLIRLNLAENKSDDALQIARQMQTQHPDSPLGFDLEADMLLSNKQHPQAIKAYELALAKGGGTAVLLKLHHALSLAGDTKTADQRLTGWIKQHPKDITARIYAAEVHMLAKRDREAAAQYDAVLKLNPNNVEALNNLAIIYQRGKDSRAVSMAEQALKLAPDSPKVQDTLGWILLEQNQVARGFELLRKAVDKAPNADTVRYHYAVALARNGRQAEAKKELRALIQSKRGFPELEEAKDLFNKL